MTYYRIAAVAMFLAGAACLTTIGFRLSLDAGLAVIAVFALLIALDLMRK